MARVDDAIAARRQQRTLDADDLAAFRAVYDALVRKGEALPPETTQSPGQRFISAPAVPFTNNVGERAARIPQVKQKISGGFRTVAGAKHFCIIRSCLDALRKQGHSMLAVLQRAFAGNPIQIAT